MAGGEYLAIIGASLFGLADVLVRKGLAKGNAFSAVYTSVLMNCLILWPIALFFTDPNKVSIYAIALLAIGGFFSTTLGRLTRFIGFSKLGLAGSTPLGASFPLFAALYATLVRGEEFTAIIGLGTVLIILGVALLSQSEWKISRIGVIISIVSAVFFGIGENFRKMGVSESGSPPLGAAIGALVAISTYTIYSQASNTSTYTPKRSRFFFAAGGVASSLGLLSNFTALILSDVVIVAPLFNTTSLFGLLFTKVLLRGYEKITSRILISALIVVTGVVLVVTR